MFIIIIKKIVYIITRVFVCVYIYLLINMWKIIIAALSAFYTIILIYTKYIIVIE